MRDAESCLLLLAELWQRRTEQGWQVVDLLEQPMTVAEAADELQVSASAVSQRHQRAAWQAGRRGEQLAVRLLDRARQAMAGRP